MDWHFVFRLIFQGLVIFGKKKLLAFKRLGALVFYIKLLDCFLLHQGLEYELALCHEGQPIMAALDFYFDFFFITFLLICSFSIRSFSNRSFSNFSFSANSNSI